MSTVTSESVSDVTSGLHEEGMVWAVSLVTFGLGDVMTTYYGLQVSGVVEQSPTAQAVLHTGGVTGMIGIKLAVFIGAYLAYRCVPKDYRAGIPIGLSLLGVLVVMNNAAVISGAL